MPLPTAPPDVAPAPIASFFDDVELTAADHESRIDTLEGTGTAVSSVNGETGAVILDAADVGAIPATALVDDDSFASATASNVPSAESVKAYVDVNVTAGGLTPVETETGTSYTVVAGDHGKVKVFTDASLVTVTLPDGIDAGTLVDLLFVGAAGGAVQDNGTSTVHGEGTVAQHGEASCLVYDADTWNVAGTTP